MTTAEILAGDLQANVAERVVSGLLLPFGEVGETNLGRFSVDAGVITIPRDITTLVANEGHNMTEPRARFLTATETPSGIVATFKIGTNEDDDALLARIAEGRTNGKPMALSVEVKGVTIKDGKATGGRMSGAAFVERGAFASAALLAAAVDTAPAVSVSVDTSAAVAAIKAVGADVLENSSATFTDADPETTTEEDADLVHPFVDETPEAPAEDSNNPTNNPESETTTVANASIPGTLNAGAPVDNKLTKGDVFAMIAGANKGDATLMAALSDVKVSGTGAIGNAAIVPEFIGEVWSGKSFERRITPLISQGTLTSLNQKGYRFVVKPQVAEWAGNKAEIPSNSPTTEEVTFAITRFAGGWDIAREFFDFGQTEVIDSFLRLAADDYARKSDAKTLSNLIAGATTATLAAGGAADATAPRVTQALVRGALRVLSADGTPTFAIVNPADYEKLLYTKELDTLGFLSQNIGLRDGTTAGFQVVAHNGITAGTVLVGDRAAAGNYELGGSPIRVNAIDLAKGGQDEALFGYVQTRIEYPAGLQLVTAINA